jgi:hypothetical protein
MRRVVLVLLCVVSTALACDRSNVVAPAAVPALPSIAVTVPGVTILATVTIEGFSSFATIAIQKPFRPGVAAGQLVSFTLSVRTAERDSVKDALVEWGDGETADLGAVSQAVTSHSFSTAGTFVLTVKVDTLAGGHISVPISLTVGG